MGGRIKPSNTLPLWNIGVYEQNLISEYFLIWRITCLLDAEWCVLGGARVKEISACLLIPAQARQRQAEGPGHRDESHITDIAGGPSPPPH